ncbi:MAG: copper-binding protein [Rubrivivax sp.]
MPLLKPFVAFTVAAALATTAVVAAAQPANAQGEVVKIDKPGLRVTIRHEGVPNLDMPAMTMAFRVGNPRLLDELNVGDKVRFAADKVGGSYMVVQMFRNR